MIVNLPNRRNSRHPWIADLQRALQRAQSSAIVDRHRRAHSASRTGGAAVADGSATNRVTRSQRIRVRDALVYLAR